MPKIGAHLSAAGGWHRALASAKALGCESLQIFLHSPGRWARPASNAEDEELFRQTMNAYGLSGAVFAHAPYLCNLAAADKVLADRSVALLVDELHLAQRLGLAGVIIHPGSAGRGPREAAVERFRQRLADVFARAAGTVPLILENTAGAGGLLGATVGELAELVEPAWWEQGNVGVCLDTAHLWAAGYDLPNEGWHLAVAQLSEAGLASSLRVVHLNDTPVACGSRRDRHAPPGEGQLGAGFFATLLADPPLSGVPCIMEIPPGPGNKGVRDALERVRGW